MNSLLAILPVPPALKFFAANFLNFLSERKYDLTELTTVVSHSDSTCLYTNCDVHNSGFEF